MIISICIVTLVISTLLIIKNGVTYRQRAVIRNAIYRYIMNLFDKDILVFDVDFHDMEEYDKTLYRLWDWSYKRILPKEKFEIIKPYINGGNEG